MNIANWSVRVFFSLLLLSMCDGDGDDNDANADVAVHVAELLTQELCVQRTRSEL